MLLFFRHAMVIFVLKMSKKNEWTELHVSNNAVTQGFSGFLCVAAWMRHSRRS